MAPKRQTEHMPQTLEAGEEVEVTFRGWLLDIRSERVKCSERWSSCVVISRAGISQQIEVMETFDDYKTAWIAGLHAGLERVDELAGCTCENSLVMINHVNRVWFRS